MEPSKDQNNPSKQDAPQQRTGFFPFLAEQRTGIRVFIFGLFGLLLFGWLFALVFGFTSVSLALPPSFDFFQFLADNRTGILVFFLGLFALAMLFQWFAWIFGLGRFRRKKEEADATTARTQSLRYIITDLFVKIITEFRHLLALIIITMFALALARAMYVAGTNIDQVKEAMQVVVATLGGLVGSIIGYYFGESTVARSQETPAAAQEAEQGEPEDDAAVQEKESGKQKEEVEAAPIPPALRKGAADTPDNVDDADDAS